MPLVRHIVLDTNALRGMNEATISRLAGLGLPLRLSDAALTEFWNQSIALYRKSGSRERARGFFFRPLKRLWRVIDQNEPLSLVGGPAVAQARALMNGQDDPEHVDRMIGAAQWFKRATTIELDDEEWLSPGDTFSAFLDNADNEWRDFNLPENRIWIERYPNEEERRSAQETWKAIPPLDLAQDTIAYMIESMKFEEALAARFDAHVRLWAWRLLHNTHSYGLARGNDGTDMVLTMHVANGGIVVTDDKRLLGAVEGSGSTHGPWVRSVEDTLSQPLPSCFPWEPGAADVVFQRANVNLLTPADRWPTVFPPRSVLTAS